MIQHARLHQAYIALSSLSLPYLSNAIDCNRGPLIITNERDVESLQECAKRDSGIFQGDVVIGPNIAGDFTLRDYGKINGSIIAENNTSLERIYLEDGDIFGRHSEALEGITIKDLPRLNSFSYPYGRGVGWDIVFQNLPVLEEVDLGILVYTLSNLELVDLPRLTSLIADDDLGLVTPMNVKIRNIGLSSVDRFLRASYGGFGSATYQIEGIPNVNTLTYSLPNSSSVEIKGNGQLAMEFRCFNCFDQKTSGRMMVVPNLKVSGLSKLLRHRGSRGEPVSESTGVGKLVVGNFKAASNNLTSLDLDFEDLKGLYVVDNTKLETILFRAEAAGYNWTDIVMTGNPVLKLTSTTSRHTLQTSDRELTPVFAWPAKDVSSMVFHGTFDSAFFQPFIDLGTDGSKRPRVLKKFSVMSTQQFDCSRLNELRKSGVLKGEYSCQGQTVADESNANRLFSSVISLILTLAAMFWVL